MIRHIPKIALLVGALAVAGQASARPGYWVGPSLLGAVVGAAVVGSVLAPRPVYVAPAPVYVAPPPVYVQAPVYVQPYPGYYRYGPPPGYYPPRW